MSAEQWEHPELWDKETPRPLRTARTIIFNFTNSWECGGFDMRVKFQRGGGRRWFRVKSVDGLKQYYPYQMGRRVIEEAIAAYAEYMLIGSAPVEPLTNIPIRGFNGNFRGKVTNV